MKPIRVKPQPGDVKHSFGDISKARSLLSFKPAISLEDGLVKTMAYFEKIST